MNEDQNQVQPDPNVYDTPRSFPIKKILSLIIGLFIVIGFIALFIFVVLPIFRSGSDDEAELVYWGIWEDENAFKEIANEFTQQNPKITIKYEKQDVKSLGKYIERLSTRANNGTGPDIFRYHNSWITQLKPLLLPLPSGVVDATELSDKFYPVVASDLNIGGAYYGIPVHFDTLALFVNADIAKAAGLTSYPTTWEDLLTTSRRVTVKDENGKIITAGVAIGTYDNIAHAPDIISLLLTQNGADLKDLNGANNLNSFDALTFYTSFAKGDSKVWDDTFENSKLAFAKGKLAMYFGYSWDIFEIKAINPDLEFAVVPVPKVSDEQNNTIASYWVEGVSSKTKHPGAAFKFLQFLGSRSSMEKLYAKESQVRPFGELYPRKDMAESLSSNALIYPFVEQGENAKSTIFSSDTYDAAMVDGLNSYLGNAVRSMLNDNTSAETAVETLAAGVTQILSRYEQNTNK